METVNPDEIRTLLTDDQTYKTWVIERLVSIEKRLDNIDSRNELYIKLLSIVLTALLGILGLLVAHVM